VADLQEVVKELLCCFKSFEGEKFVVTGNLCSLVIVLPT